VEYGLVRRTWPPFGFSSLPVLVACAAFALTMAFAENARAASDTWDCGVIGPHIYCPYLYAQNFAQVWAYYNGPTETKVTSELRFASDNRIWGEAFGQSNNGERVMLFSYRYKNTRARISNNGDYSHTIVGTVVW
jgi:hypothetical protein